jgi:hypothetical protein
MRRKKRHRRPVPTTANVIGATDPPSFMIGRTRKPDRDGCPDRAK